ncbi:hypothetical protein KOR42_20240 [Thalassoglobus neptunius]|uniref:Uncharacterized protein n=2 Tax=Thalassoglobus neptunius TaxID=1938619 RepID=A0A5C5X9V4_9PLAN|nr:hypothetical protein KOR42_20240 [Thalassoglobus neptunius]
MIDQAEALKRQLTDKYVVVNEGVAELRRFVGLTGRVKTVNMNCRALVQFDGPVDISWYDIDPSFLKVVDAPLPKKKEKPAEAKPKAGAVPKKPASGQSPLEMARKQGAAGAEAEASAPPASEPAPVEEAPVEQPAAEEKSEPAASSSRETPSSTEEIIALAKQQGPFKG